MTRRKTIPIADIDSRMIIVGAFRYYLGRMTISVSSFTNWLVQRWHNLDEGTQFIIAREIEEAFKADDDQRLRVKETGGNLSSIGLPLGWDCDRAAWARVRTMYRTPRCCLCGKELPDTVHQNVHMDGERSCWDCAPPTCEVCEGEFRLGEQIIPNPKTRRARHPGCKPKGEERQ